MALSGWWSSVGAAPLGQACSHNVETSGGRDVQSRNDVVIALKKQNPQSRWAALGKIERPVKKPLLSVRCGVQASLASSFLLR